MGSYDRYLIERCLAYGLGATLVLTVTIVFSQSQRLVEAVTNFGMPFDVFMGLLFTLAPFMADGTLIAGLVVGVIFVFLEGRGSKELLMTQALGMSPWRRFVPFALVALLFMVVQLLLSMLVVPPTLREHQETRRDFRSEVNLEDALTAGVTAEITPNTSLYLTERLGRQNFRGVRLFDSTLPGSEVTVFANRGAITTGLDGLSIMLFEGMKIDERRGDALAPVVTTFTALPVIFDRSSGGFAAGALSPIAPQNGGQPVGRTRGSAPPERTDDSARGDDDSIDVTTLTPSEVPAAIAFATAMHVLRALRSDEDLSVQPIRVPSNEFHRRVAAALTIPAIIWLVFVFLSTDHHLRRPPIWGFVAIAAVVVFALLVARVAMEGVAREPRNFYYIYLGALLPLPVIAAKILVGRRS